MTKRTKKSRSKLIDRRCLASNDPLAIKASLSMSKFHESALKTTKTAYVRLEI